MVALSGRALGRAPAWLPVALVLCAFVFVCWVTLVRLGPAGGFDSAEFKAYAAYLAEHGRLPPKRENYEYALPPGLPLVGNWATDTVDALPWAPPQLLSDAPGWLRRVAWLVLAIGGLLAAGLARSGSRLHRAGFAGAGVAVVWATFHALAYAKQQPWVVQPLVAFASQLGLIVVTALIARELWPTRRHAPGLAALALATLPVMPRMALFFHPDPPFALLCAVALLFVIRAAGRGWRWEYAIAAGAALGAAGLVRQAAPAVVVALGAGVLLVGRRRALPFLAIGTAAILLVAGPWWAYQASRYGNPIESNLDRPGYMLDRQPLSFFVSLPPELVTRPYRESFRNELLPKLHAELWSDWFGGLRRWVEPRDVDRGTASTQSVLGLGGDALVLFGLFGIGAPAVRRAVRDRGSPLDRGLAVITTMTLLAFLAFVVTLVRFPQIDGDPIKSHYLLFLAPGAAILGLAAGYLLWERGRVWRVALLAWGALYVASYAVLLASAPSPGL